MSLSPSKYCSDFFAQFKKETKLWFWQRLFIPISLAILSLAIRWFFAARDEVMSWILFAIVPVIVFVVGVSLWNFFRTSYILARQADENYSKEIKTLKQEKDDDFLKRTPQYIQDKKIAKLALNFFEGRLAELDKKDSWPDGWEDWNKENERLIADLAPFSLRIYREHRTPEGCMREVESILNNFVPIRRSNSIVGV